MVRAWARMALFMSLLLASVETARAGDVLRGYAARVAPESARDRYQRHRLVAKRRAGTSVLVHRGAWSLAPENTLEACAAAMDCGADGCEVDLRRTADGVLVLFHDDTLERMTEGLGAVQEWSYAELLALLWREPWVGHAARVPTFAALLNLARQRGMLLHLDLKEPGLENDVARLLEEADAWDHVAFINENHAATLRAKPQIHMLEWKAALYAGRADLDPQAVEEAVGRPGQMLIVDDPRVTTFVMRRPGLRLVPLPESVFADWPMVSGETPAAGAGSGCAAVVRRLERTCAAASVEDLFRLLAGDGEVAPPVDAGDDYWQARGDRIVERAWAAQQLGRRGSIPDEVRLRLHELVTRPTGHRNWRYTGLDGALAAHALARLGDCRLIADLTGILPGGARVGRGGGTESVEEPAQSWRKRSHGLAALGELRCEGSPLFLYEYVMSAVAADPPDEALQVEDATRALLRHEVSAEQLEALFICRQGGVRGTALLECVDRSSRPRRDALRTTIPWALKLASPVNRVK